MVAFRTGHGSKTTAADNGADGFVVEARLRPYNKGGTMVLTMVVLISLSIIPTMERFAMVRLSTTGSSSLFEATALQGRVGNSQNTGIVIEDPNPSSLPLPRVAWLMTYPNSVGFVF